MDTNVMDTYQAIQSRKATRAFTEQTVEPDIINRILDAARHAPSGANTQPWQVAVVMGETKQRLERRIEQAFRGGTVPKMDYQYYPLEWQEPYKGRRKHTAIQLYGALNIQRDETARQQDQWVANYRAFDAPVVLYFFLDPGMQTGSFLDYGAFLQSLMLAAVAEGLATCPQAALGEYPDIVKQELAYPLDTVLICGMAIGYENTQAAVNSYRTPREAVSSFTRYFE